jgi:ATP-dependent Lon protease
MTDTKVTEATLPVLPLRDIVVFPHMIVPLFVGRDRSVTALDAVMEKDKKIILLTQKTPSEDDPAADDLHTIGTMGTILQLLKLPDGTVKVLVEGGERVQINGLDNEGDYMNAEYDIIKSENAQSEELMILSKTVSNQFEDYVKLNKKIPPEVIVSVNQITEIDKLADTIASHLALKLDEKQELLELHNTAERLELIFQHMEDEMGVLHVEKKIRNRVKRQMEKTQREYYLNEQMKAIQKELHEDEEAVDEMAELEAKIKKTKLSKDARKKAESEFKKLKQTSPMSAEASVSRNYLDWMLSVPWGKKSRMYKDLKKAKATLDKDHYGLEKVKERILEYLAVQHRANKVKGPILCLVGPPGVGKTSLGHSISKSTNRPFVRMSLGGVRDESEIRGQPVISIG